MKKLLAIISTAAFFAAPALSYAQSAYETLLLVPKNGSEIIQVLHNPGSANLSVDLELCVPPTRANEVKIYGNRTYWSSIGVKKGTGPNAFYLGCTSMTVDTGALIQVSIPSGQPMLLLKKIKQVH